jgi:predicted N-acetyltransferase YhbS
MLSVDPAWQRQGLGRILVRAAENHCRAAGCRALDIDVVNLRSELPPFYSKLGFVPTGRATFPDPGKLQRAAYVVIVTKPDLTQPACSSPRTEVQP